MRLDELEDLGTENWLNSDDCAVRSIPNWTFVHRALALHMVVLSSIPGNLSVCLSPDQNS